MAAKQSAQGNLFEDLPPGRGGGGGGRLQDSSLAQEAQRRYLNYALSVITARALPDVRDGLKPVQRRILYAMHQELHLRSDTRHRKCALIVGDVMGKFHPHGDTAIYDALARLAQPFSMRAPLVDGRGNFGSPDGDAPAAMRYTEARLHKLADELLAELSKRTVAFRPNYDGTRFEAVVLPARFPNLLVNGSQGIAVGMATSIPPHNLGEVIDACLALIENPDLSLAKLTRFIKGPDFPTGGQVLSSKREIDAVYAAGQGSLKLRGTWEIEERKRGGPQIVITSIPYGIERRAVVEAIAEVIVARKLPLLVDVRDESTDDCRIVLEVKRESDPQLVMAYLYKHTPLQMSVQVNLTCLVPTDNPEIAAPERLDLVQMLRHFLAFRLEVLTKRIEFDLAELKRRIHILEGFITIFDALDETIRIVRRSQGKEDAGQKLGKRFEIDEEQVDAILELKLYRLAQLEIHVLRQELEDKRKEARRLEQLLKSEPARWKLMSGELTELKERYADKRRTKLVGAGDEPEYDAEAFIVEEDAVVLLSRQGWVKRQREVKDLSTTRMREGDDLLDAVAGSTKAAVAFFSNFGTCFVCRVVDVPASTGYGVPVQTLFKLDDGERIIRMLTFDPRIFEVPPPTEGASEPEPPLALAVTRRGLALRFSLRGHREPSTRSGRRYLRLNEGDEAIHVAPIAGGELVACAAESGHALLCDVDEVALLSGPGKGVMLIKLAEGDRLVGAALLPDSRAELVVESETGRRFEISSRKYDAVSRAGKGFQLFKRGALARVIEPPAVLHGLPPTGAES